VQLSGRAFSLEHYLAVLVALNGANVKRLQGHGRIKRFASWGSFIIGNQETRITNSLFLYAYHIAADVYVHYLATNFANNRACPSATNPDIENFSWRRRKNFMIWATSIVAPSKQSHPIAAIFNLANAVSVEKSFADIFLPDLNFPTTTRHGLAPRHAVLLGAP
jgi:hypothetical protein